MIECISVRDLDERLETTTSDKESIKSQIHLSGGISDNYEKLNDLFQKHGSITFRMW